MNETAYDKSKMRAYLLGSLTEAETEELDELSFTDDDFAGELNASEKDLIDAYARGELAGAELKRFEDHYAASPLRREKIEFAGAFQIFAEKNGAAAVEKPKRPFWGLFAGRESFRPFRYAAQFGLAAAALFFVIAGGWLWSENRRLSEQAGENQKRRDEIERRELELEQQRQTGRTEKTEIENELGRLRAERERLENELARETTPTPQPLLSAQNRSPEREPKQPPQSKKQPERAALEKPPADKPDDRKPPSVGPRAAAIASIILAPPLRDGQQIPTLSLAPDTALVAARLRLETGEFAAYRVALVDLSNRTLWRSGKLAADRSGDGPAVTVRLPARLLKPQIYALVVSGLDANGAGEEIGSYPLRVVLN